MMHCRYYWCTLPVAVIVMVRTGCYRWPWRTSEPSAAADTDEESGYFCTQHGTQWVNALGLFEEDYRYELVGPWVTT